MAGLPALLAVFTAAACADFFLYDPIYSFDISSRVEFSDLARFSLLALITVKCASELFRPSEKIPAEVALRPDVIRCRAGLGARADRVWPEVAGLMTGSAHEPGIHNHYRFSWAPS